MSLIGYDAGTQYDVRKCLIQLLVYIYLNGNDHCMMINKFESIFCNDCNHTTYINGVCVDSALHLEDSSHVQRISGMLHQFMDPREYYLKNYWCDCCGSLSASTKAVCFMQVSTILTI